MSSPRIVANFNNVKKRLQLSNNINTTRVSEMERASVLIESMKHRLYESRRKNEFEE